MCKCVYILKKCLQEKCKTHTNAFLSLLQTCSHKKYFTCVVETEFCTFAFFLGILVSWKENAYCPANNHH